MAEEKMQNPYEKDGVAESNIALSRRATCWVIAAFILIVLLPPLYRNVFEAANGGWVPVTELFKKDADKTFIEHREKFEGDLEDKATFTDPPRQFVQGALTGSFREGNRKTYIGRDGWLYLKSALDAMTGYGPITPEPDSVAKDPNRKPWAAPLDAIKEFAAQLDELGVELTLVPIPVKPMIYPEHITGKSSTEPLQHRDAEKFYAEISALPNVNVIDLTEAFWSAKDDKQIFLKQDTHWTPAGMQLAAEKIAAQLPTGTNKATNLADPAEVKSVGDLVDQLELPGEGLQWFLRDTAITQPITGFEPEPTAEITLLGDSFTNIYSSKSLDWGTGAGLAEHLAHKLQQPLDVIAINGQASTGVRKELAKRGRDHLKKKKTVIWAIAARDLFLSESAARSSNVLWEKVDIPDISEKSTNSDSQTLRGKLVSKSKIADPATVTYKNALFVSEFKDTTGETFFIKEWAFKNKDYTEASQRDIGAEIEFTAIPFDSQTEIQGEQEFDDYDDDPEQMLQTRFWPIKKTAAEQGAVAAKSPNRSHLIASLACAIAALLVVALGRRLNLAEPV